MQLKVFYVDDEFELCECFSDAFATKGIVIKTFTDPQAAIAAAQVAVPDLLVIDYRLPGTNGDKVAQLMPAAIPKFLITGDISVKTKYEFIKTLSKPWDEVEIRGILSSYLAKVTV